MTDMFNNRDTPATVEHARSIIRKLEGTKVSDFDVETVHRGRLTAGEVLRQNRGSSTLGNSRPEALRRFFGRRASK